MVYLRCGNMGFKCELSSTSKMRISSNLFRKLLSYEVFSSPLPPKNRDKRLIGHMKILCLLAD
jgi:hypothetical protein